MKKVLFSITLAALAGSAFASDYSDLQYEVERLSSQVFELQQQIDFPEKDAARVRHLMERAKAEKVAKDIEEHGKEVRAAEPVKWPRAGIVLSKANLRK